MEETNNEGYLSNGASILRRNRGRIKSSKKHTEEKNHSRTAKPRLFCKLQTPQLLFVQTNTVNIKTNKCYKKQKKLTNNNVEKVRIFFKKSLMVTIVKF